ncbi:terminase small subunit [Citrobacter portucalensis]|uniref:terminase small subunit n=1 Tax=Citrobacter portucalensis TaxID=1639133 RepID=UPI00397CBD6C
MEVNKKRLSEIFGVSVRTIQNWQDQGMPVARGGGKGNEVLYESSAAKQVEAFRYNTNGIDALRHLIHGADVA